jgi:hypothetical protein
MVALHPVPELLKADSKGALVGIATFLLKDGQNLNFAIAAEEYWR